MNEKMRDNWPILEQACGNAGLIKKCVQIPQDAGHLTGLCILLESDTDSGIECDTDNGCGNCRSCYFAERDIEFLWRRWIFLVIITK